MFLLPCSFIGLLAGFDDVIDQRAAKPTEAGIHLTETTLLTRMQKASN